MAYVYPLLCVHVSFVLVYMDLKRFNTETFLADRSELLKTPHVDSLLTGPYIALPTKDNKDAQFSFKTFLDYYDFAIVNYNHYEIVNKVEVFAETASTIEIDNTFHLTFTNKTKSARIVQLVTQLFHRR